MKYFAHCVDIYTFSLCRNFQANIYLFKVNNRNNKKGVKYVQS